MSKLWIVRLKNAKAATAVWHLLAIKHDQFGERVLTLVVGHLVSSFIDSCEREVAILPHLSILNTIYDEGLIASSIELGLVSVIDVF